MHRNITIQFFTLFIAVAVLAAALYLGRQASLLWLGRLIVGGAVIVLMRQPVLGLFALIGVALTLPVQIGTGTEVFLYPTVLVVPALIGVWLIHILRSHSLAMVTSRANRPLLLFLLVGLLSLAIGHVFWDPSVPKPNHFIVVQVAQWGIFALSAGAFWLAANWLTDMFWLRRMTFFFLVVGGVLAIWGEFVSGGMLQMTGSRSALVRAPFWVLLFAVAGGQLLFNEKLERGWRLFLGAALAASLVYAFGQADERASNWVGITAVLGVLFWFRFPRLRWPVTGITLVLLMSGILLPFLYEFAGGDARWFESGGARLALIERTIAVTAANPITGIGPAAYRYYAATQPLIYEHIVWFDPLVASHNNYVDLYSHVGLLGLALFFWFMVEVAKLGWRLRRYYPTGFASGYIHGMLAAWLGMIVIMALADWFLPFVYNIQFLGFQASVLVWLFLGGLVALEQFARQKTAGTETGT